VSTLEEKLEQVEKELRADTGRARAFLRKHLTYSCGTPRYTVIRSDSSAPVIIQTVTMDGKHHLWRRVYFERNDILFESVVDGEDHESYFANPKQDAAPKKKRAGTGKTSARAKKSK
jgi:hypothetical protein